MKKVVLITGASSGMGKETAKLLAQNNYTVYAAARRTEKMKDLEAKIKDLEVKYSELLDLTKNIFQIVENLQRSRKEQLDMISLLAEKVEKNSSNS